MADETEEDDFYEEANRSESERKAVFSLAKSIDDKEEE